VFIAAMLTVVGYSINDTVVVFDRIREFANMATAKEDLSSVLNRAINQTLSRTIMTSLVTLLVVLVLLFFGGEVLRGFSFALVIGIIFGTYSSIFIASPVILDFSKRK
jgi:SecD/SecF fusion protein